MSTYPGPPSDTRATEPDSGSASPILEVLVVFVVVFALQWLTSLVGAMASLFVLTPPLETNPWTIVTSVYAHGGIGHLLSNSVALIVFGWPVARATTRIRFHVFFLVTGSLAGISQILVPGLATAMPFVPGTPTAGVLGASGAVFALLGYLIASNRLSAGLASFVDVPRWLAWVVFLGLAIAVTLATAAPGVALIAHFTGFLLGLLAGRARILNAGR
ncbi:rhomboid family intramembrane serine protease [Salinadaptatus halalkaliphilus]|uniref:Rhomboid family intramembrane serine protease n=1 Tax=Salinadaptatus halalkaliphilus TaxID=2419781 RepID=A0A4S3TLB7_9EURY|nr:rhomboid family intramembrane serine protease [Salinadaptatus halalkaliphilus]THE64952.1 rhomboid family intramembrane serine protease [Salinadaptatus halalkaliphilus]